MLYWQLVLIALRAQMQYPTSFVMLATAHFFSTFVDILGIWVLFDRFKLIQGWTLPEVGLIYGIIHMGFALAETLARGFDTFSLMVKNGEFDRLLLRPLSTLLQVAACDVQLMRLGGFLQGLIVLLISAWSLQIPIISSIVLLIILSIAGTAALFYGLLIMQAALSFWTIETLELMNITTYGGVETGQYPMSIYKPPLRLFFTFVIPLAFVAYYPVATALLHEPFPLMAGLLFPLAGWLFLALACAFWHYAVRAYQSTGH